MIELLRYRMSQIPLRVRLTLWYLLLLGFAVSVFGVYQYFQLRRTLLASVDASLKLAATQALANVDMENGRPSFQNTENWSIASSALLRRDFAVRLLAPDGTVWDEIGATDLPLAGVPATRRYETLTEGMDQHWRIYTHTLQNASGEVIGWLQAIQSLDVVSETLENMRLQLVAGLLLVLLFAGAGGVFLADRALRPIDYITRTAQSIGAGDLSHRIAYRGPNDEVGRLARTFDQMLARLQAAFERERRFTGDAAHELRTPLTAIKGQIEVSLSRSRRPEEYRSTLQRLLEQVDRLIRLSNALLFLSRSDQRRLVWNPAPVDLTELLTVLTEQIQSLAEEKRLILLAEITPDLSIYGDTDHLIRLFLNLIDNAVKYTPPEGEITLRAQQTADKVEVVIHNTGPGIPAEHQLHLFERFYRVDDDRASATGGSGLGLAIAHEIVRLHDGQIQMSSEPGEGVTVTVSLPAQGEST